MLLAGLVPCAVMVYITILYWEAFSSGCSVRRVKCLAMLVIAVCGRGVDVSSEEFMSWYVSPNPRVTFSGSNGGDHVISIHVALVLRTDTRGGPTGANIV